MSKYTMNESRVDTYGISGAIDALVRAYAAVSDETIRKEIKIKLVELIKEL